MKKIDNLIEKYRTEEKINLDLLFELSKLWGKRTGLPSPPKDILEQVVSNQINSNVTSVYHITRWVELEIDLYKK